VNPRFACAAVLRASARRGTTPLHGEVERLAPRLGKHHAERDQLPGGRRRRARGRHGIFDEWSWLRPELRRRRDIERRAVYESADALDYARLSRTNVDAGASDQRRAVVYLQPERRGLRSGGDPGLLAMREGRVRGGRHCLRRRLHVQRGRVAIALLCRER
jgi:hypothetical protein